MDKFPNSSLEMHGLSVTYQNAKEDYLTDRCTLMKLNFL